jgi:hypothetical protein
LDLSLKVWNYTACWFEDQIGLDNSAVLLPQDASKLPNTIINHCRWDRLRDILPAIAFTIITATLVLVGLGPAMFFAVVCVAAFVAWILTNGPIEDANSDILSVYLLVPPS